MKKVAIILVIIVLLLGAWIVLGLRAQGYVDIAGPNIYFYTMHKLLRPGVELYVPADRCPRILRVDWKDFSNTTFDVEAPSGGRFCRISTGKVNTSLKNRVFGIIEVIIVAPAPRVDLKKALENPHFHISKGGGAELEYNSYLKPRVFTVQTAEKDGFIIYHVEGRKK